MPRSRRDPCSGREEVDTHVEPGHSVLGPEDDILDAMAALFPVHVPAESEEQRVLLSNVSWATYVGLRDSIENPAARMTYLEGSLEITTTSRRHEVSKVMIARLVELFCLERDIALYGHGQMTLRKEEKRRGLEPDVWYARGEDRLLPEIAIEVIITRGAINKLDVYRGLGIREIWLYENAMLRVLALRDDGYVQAARSEVIPEIDPERVSHFVAQPDQHGALVAFRDELRAAR